MTDAESAGAQHTRVIGLVDDDRSFRTAMARLLRTAGYEVTVFSSAEQFTASDAAANLGCLLLDVNMPGRSGLELQEALTRIGGDVPIVFVTGYGDVPQSVRAMKLGAVDFLTKPVALSVLLEAIKRAFAQGALLRAERKERLQLVRRFGGLTPRERQVFQMVVNGRMNKQIASALGTTVHTVKIHRHRVMAKMEAESLTELVRMAMKLTPHQPRDPQTA